MHFSHVDDGVSDNAISILAVILLAYSSWCTVLDTSSPRLPRTELVYGARFERDLRTAVSESKRKLGELDETAQKNLRRFVKDGTNELSVMETDFKRVGMENKRKIVKEGTAAKKATKAVVGEVRGGSARAPSYSSSRYRKQFNLGC